MSARHEVCVRGVNPIEVRLDPFCSSAYIKLRNGKVHRTIAREDAWAMVVVDVGDDSSIIGIELVGVRDLSVRGIRHSLPAQLRDIRLEGARFVSAEVVGETSWSCG